MATGICNHWVDQEKHQVVADFTTNRKWTNGKSLPIAKVIGADINGVECWSSTCCTRNVVNLFSMVTLYSFLCTQLLHLFRDGNFLLLSHWCIHTHGNENDVHIWNWAVCNDHYSTFNHTLTTLYDSCFCVCCWIWNETILYWNCIQLNSLSWEMETMMMIYNTTCISID